jgi:hypothetical protein
MRKLRHGQLVLWHRSPVTYREYYYALLRPWEHYVPLESDLSNLELVRAWLDTAEGRAEGKRIRDRALELMRVRFRRQDLLCYIVRLLQCLAELADFALPDALEALAPALQWTRVEPFRERTG